MISVIEPRFARKPRHNSWRIARWSLGAGLAAITLLAAAAAVLAWFA